MSGPVSAAQDPATQAGARLVYLMGASGSGKDTLLRLLQSWLHDEPVRVAQRCITRPAGPDEASVHVSEADFARIAAAGGFALHWRSHGLHYGIGVEIDRHMAAGAVVVVNGSRRHLAQARARYPAMTAVEIVVDPAVLASRLARRGRESAEQIAQRLAAAVLPLDDAGAPGRLHRIENNAEPERAARALLELARGLLCRADSVG
ncbi:phosphonate metabolism protein/1,5-bisphosphokinase (PRPP-forming) PhnN [Bordetella sp. 2513F-2]